MIVIIDYGMGNLRSAQKGIEKSGHEAVISDDPRDIATADAVVLPGVGAYGDCYDGLKSRNMIDPVLEAAKSGKPFLGICVGLQLMFESSEEGDVRHGLGIFPGRVVRFRDARETGLKVPHMGWNAIQPRKEANCPLFKDSAPAPYMYFVHSYYPQPEDPSVIMATANYGIDFPAMVGRGNVFATQFHPEKSQREGLKILKAFGDLAKQNGR